MTNKYLAQLNKQLKSEIDKKTAIEKSQWQFIESLLKTGADDVRRVQKEARNKAD